MEEAGDSSLSTLGFEGWQHMMNLEVWAEEAGNSSFSTPGCEG